MKIEEEKNVKKLTRDAKQRIVDTICGLPPRIDLKRNPYSFHALERWEKHQERVKETIKIIELVLGEVLDRE